MYFKIITCVLQYSIQLIFGTEIIFFVKKKLKIIFILSFSFRVIQNVADSRPKVRYLIAKDDAQNTLEEIVKVCA